MSNAKFVNKFVTGNKLVLETQELPKMIRKGVKYIHTLTISDIWRCWYEDDKVTRAKSIMGNLELEKKYGKKWRELSAKDGYILWSSGNAWVESTYYIPSDK